MARGFNTLGRAVRRPATWISLGLVAGAGFVGYHGADIPSAFEATGLTNPNSAELNAQAASIATGGLGNARVYDPVLITRTRNESTGQWQAGIQTMVNEGAVNAGRANQQYETEEACVDAAVTTRKPLDTLDQEALDGAMSSDFEGAFTPEAKANDTSIAYWKCIDVLTLQETVMAETFTGLSLIPTPPSPSTVPVAPGAGQ